MDTYYRVVSYLVFIHSRCHCKGIYSNAFFLSVHLITNEKKKDIFHSSILILAFWHSWPWAGIPQHSCFLAFQLWLSSFPAFQAQGRLSGFPGFSSFLAFSSSGFLRCARASEIWEIRGIF